MDSKYDKAFVSRGKNQQSNDILFWGSYKKRNNKKGKNITRPRGAKKRTDRGVAVFERNKKPPTTKQIYLQWPIGHELLSGIINLNLMFMDPEKETAQYTGFRLRTIPPSLYPSKHNFSDGPIDPILLQLTSNP